jgi:perosamine synthetase
MVAPCNAVIDVGCLPLVVDNSSKIDLNPSIQSYQHYIENAEYKNKISAIIVTHTYGVPFEDIDVLADYCSSKKIFLIEDIAEAVGTKYKGRLVGTYGDIATASLYANKIITSGDGGFTISKHKFLNG